MLEPAAPGGYDAEVDANVGFDAAASLDSYWSVGDYAAAEIDSFHGRGDFLEKRGGILCLAGRFFVVIPVPLRVRASFLRHCDSPCHLSVAQ